MGAAGGAAGETEVAVGVEAVAAAEGATGTPLAAMGTVRGNPNATGAERWATSAGSAPMAVLTSASIAR